jgi:hypothetical protein
MRKELEMKNQVIQILTLVKKIAPGRSVELRIPPYAAIQCVDGKSHRRGTPPNVVEMSSATLLKLVDNPDQWQFFCDVGCISASGQKSNLASQFKIVSKILNNQSRDNHGK